VPWAFLDNAPQQRDNSCVSNVRRLLLTNRIFYVTVRLRKSIPRFSPAEFPVLVAAVEKSRRKLGFLLAGYVLMPDHWHALLGVRDPLTISRAVQDIKWISAIALNRQRTRRGPVWQHQFWDRFVRNQRELGERLEYMHWNPVRKGLVGRREAWIWSSCLNYSMERGDVARCPIQVDYVRLVS
jgi:putative transposase